MLDRLVGKWDYSYLFLRSPLSAKPVILQLHVSISRTHAVWHSVMQRCLTRPKYGGPEGWNTTAFHKTQQHFENSNILENTTTIWKTTIVWRKQQHFGKHNNNNVEKNNNILENTTTFWKTSFWRKQHFGKHNSTSQNTTTTQFQQHWWFLCKMLCFPKCCCVLTLRAAVQSSWSYERMRDGDSDDEMFGVASRVFFNI